MLALGKRIGQIDSLTAQRVVVFLSGDLGAGKTTLVRGLLRGLGYDGTVKSPTYTLVEPYALAQVSVYHIDLYRVNDPQELEYTGIRDSFDEAALFLVEWPHNGRSALPAPDLEVHIVRPLSGRQITLKTPSSIGRRLFSFLECGQ